MKLGNLFWMNTELDTSTYAVNFGDVLQFRIIDEIFEEYFPNEEVIKLSLKDMPNYRGEKIILPLNWSLFDNNFMNNYKINISEDIIPIYLAATIENVNYDNKYINEYNLNYLKKYQPIGCRDEITQQTLINNGVEAYLNGCMTSCFKSRSALGKKILLVDAPDELKKYMPKWDCNVEVFSQQEYFDCKNNIQSIRKIVDDRYDYYFKEAQLVITSRLHVASPCLAVGIPVIFAKKVIDARLTWLENYIPLYDKSNFDKINWTPCKVEYEHNKDIILSNAVQRIKNALFGVNKQVDYKKVDSLFEKNKTLFPSFIDVLNSDSIITDFLNQKYSKKSSFTYAIWGIGKKADKIFKYISENYVNAKLVSVLDTYKTGEFYGIKIINPKDYIRSLNEIMIVIPVQASNAAQTILQSKGFSDNDYVCAGDIFINSI